MEALRLESLSRSFGGDAVAVNQVDLQVASGEFFCLLGPSGCGKTTLLQLIGGYLKPNAGDIYIAQERVTAYPPERRRVGMVFQNYALFPHLSARENVAFGLEVRRVARSERRQRVETMLDRVGLSQGERKRYPRELSGGQQQRVALARALVIQPDLLLLDEPLANLDRKLRDRLRGELRDIQRQTGVTTLFVTHDQEEAFAIADRVGVMVQGQFLQVDRPTTLYQQPTTPTVAQFVGEANLLKVESVTTEAVHLLGGLTLSAPPKGIKTGDWLLLRPEFCVVGEAAFSCTDYWQGQVLQTTFLGSDRVLEVEITPEMTLKVRQRPEHLSEIEIGDKVPVGWKRDRAWVIPQSDPAWALEPLTASNH